MAHYINKDAVVAELERLIELFTIPQYSCEYNDAKADGFREILSFINTLEVKEVELDIEKRIKECHFRQVACNRYEDTPVICDGRCSWVADYPRLKELKAQIGE